MANSIPIPVSAAPEASAPTNARKRIVFERGSAFQKELQQRVQTYLSESGAHGRATWRMWLKTTTIMLWFLATYLTYLLVPGPWWMAGLLGIASGLAQAGIGFCIQHDGGHRAYSKSRVVNRLMASSLDFLGGSSYMWHWKHNVFHHTYPNIDGIDDDISVSPLARLAPTQPHRGFHRWQWLYMWGLYGLLSLKWHFIDDFLVLAKGALGDHRQPRPKGWELAGLIAGKLLWACWMFVIPALLLEWQWVLAFYVGSEFTLGLVMGAVFQLAHCVDGVGWETLPDDGGDLLELDWAEHQMRTTVDFARSSKWITWYVGGLNFQTVHHLFPKICHEHYPEISRILEEVSEKHGIPYNVSPSLTASLASHTHWLRRMGREEVAA